MEALERIRAALPEAAKDLKLNLQTVLGEGALDERRRWGVALACAFASGSALLRDAMLSDARGRVDDAIIEDARAAAALMGMNNVYYRARHWLGETYEQKPARLRMHWVGKPRSGKAEFELFSLAVSAIGGCEVCVQSHEKSLGEHDVTSDEIHDAIRIAAVVRGVAVAVEGLSEPPSGIAPPTE